MAACFSPLALANPVGPTVVNGAATVANNGSTMTVTNTPGAILNWQQFNIGQGQTTQFNQQSAQSSVLNRVTGPDTSQIMGTLRSNGQVFLVNPNGILFGAGSVIDVNRLIASTLNITDANFLANNLRFDGNGGTSVVNQGQITTPIGGSVYLIGNNVANEGVITTPQGEVVLAAGNSVSMVNSFTPHVSVTMSAPAGGQAVNLGQVTAQGGSINIYGPLIRQHGIVSADSARADAQGNILFSATQSVELAQGSSTTASGANGGNIRILANMQTGTVNVSGTLDASAINLPSPAGGRGAWGEGNGGFIETSAAHVNIADTARVITTSSNGKSGLWLIDPFDFTIAATGGNITGAALSSNLGGGNVTIQSTTGTTGTLGDVNVNDAVAWSANKLTLNAQNNININANLNGSGTASLALEYGQQAVAAGNLSDYIVHAAVNLPAGNNFSTKLGSDGVAKNYTVITGLGVAGSTTATDLQGINGSLALNYALGGNIDASATSGWNAGAGFLPIAMGAPGFSGTFDGLNHTISGLFINRPVINTDIGLFGYLATGGIVQNVGLVDGSVTGNNPVGGLVGISSGTIRNSYNTGAVTTTCCDTGGLVGANGGIIINSYATGSVSGGANTGGLAGYNSTGTVINSYATGLVTGSGGLVGNNFGGPNVVTNSFWDTQTSGQPTSFGGTGKTTAQMMAQASFTGFDFTNTWWMSEGNTRPFLRNEYSTTITNAHQLQLMAMNLSASYTLGANINMAELTSSASGMWDTTKGFVPIGNSTSNFTGTFDGLGHTVSNLTINRPTADYVGLFGYAGTGSMIRNVGLAGGSVTGQSFVGELAGIGRGTVSNSYATGSVNGGNNTNSSAIGGLLGYNNGIISNSYATGNVSGTVGWVINSSSGQIGGLVGYNDVGTISSSYATGSVSGGFYVGGLVGVISPGGIISNSYATGSASASGYSGSGVGGLLGYNWGAIVSNSYATGSVSGNNTLGGLVGKDQSGAVTNSFWDTQTTGRSTSSGGTGLTTTQMKTMASFTGWNIAATGGTGAVWRIYEGHTAPLLTSFMTGLTLTGAPDVFVASYNGAAQSGGAFTLIPNVLGAAATGTNAGFYNGYYSTQQGYNITGGNLIINKAILNVIANAASKTYDGLAYSGGNGVAYSGFVNSETNAVLGGALSYGGTSQGAINAGNYLITPGGLTSGNYTLSYVDGALTIVAVIQTCLTNPVLCANSPTVNNPLTTTVVVAPTTAATSNITYSTAPAVTVPAVNNSSTTSADVAPTTAATGNITYSLAQAVTAASDTAINNDIRQTKSEARKADDEAQKAEEKVKQAKAPQEKAVARQHAEVKSGEADVKRAGAKIHEAESELRAAEAEVASVKSTQEKVRAETRKAIAEAKRAEGEVDKVAAEAKLAEAEAKGAKTPEARMAAETKQSAAEAKKTEAEAKKAEVDARKAETELKQAEAEAKTGGSPEAKAVVEAKKAELESKKAEVEIKKIEAEAKSAKDPVAKAAVETRLATAEAKKADAEAKQADVEAKLADTEAGSSSSPVAKLVAETKKAEAEAKKAEAEVKNAQVEAKSANDPERKMKAEVKAVVAEVRKADAEAKKADAEVKLAEAKAKNTNKAEDKKEVEDKKAEAQVKKADVGVKKAEAEVKTAKGSGEKEAAELKRAEAEVKKVEAEYKKAEREAKHDRDEARSPQSGYLKNAVEKKAEASAAKAEAKQAELEAKQAKTPEARAAAEKRFEAKRAEADKKETEFKDAKRSSDNKIIESFGGMSLASTAKERVQEAMVARHEFKAETLKPALNILKADPKAADLKPCGQGGGDVCIRPVNPAMANPAANILPRVQLPLPTPIISFLPTIQRKVAVVIGNNAYQDSSLPSLNGAAKDADAVSKMLKEKMGYDVRMVHNGTKADIVRALNQVSDETGSKDSVVVYYAGHGYQMEDTKVGYWIPSDASAESPNKWISNSDINKMLANIPAKQMILMSDSCFSGTLAGEQKVTSGSVAGKSVQEILGKRSVLVMSSGGEEPVIDEGKEGHSIFAWHLMDKLNKVEQYKNGADVFDAVKAGVAKDGIPQTPQYGASVSAGHMAGGEYLFEVRKY